MSVDACRARFLRELGQLRAQFPADDGLIGSFESIIGGDGDVEFALLISLVGPSAPVCADALWECVGGFLRDLRRLELFTGPVQSRRPWAGAVEKTSGGRYSRYTPPSVRPVIQQYFS